MKEWISVKDDLPKIDQRVLVCGEGYFKDKESSIQIWYRDKENDWVMLDSYTPFKITHWMPLPKPPKY